MKKVLLAVCGLVSLTSCDTCEKRQEVEIIVTNKSDRPVRIFWASVEAAHQYPDTAINEMSTTMQPVKPGLSGYWFVNDPWENVFNSLPGDTLSIFIFSQDTIDAYPWEEIRQQYKVLKRYDLSLEDLKRLDFKISYPPDERMAGIKMYP